jgi:hypothetical protein
MGKTHFLTMLNNEYGGHTFLTLCGKSAPVSSPDGLNGSDKQAEVDCLLCKQHMNNEKSWRWDRYLKYGVK